MKWRGGNSALFRYSVKAATFHSHFSPGLYVFDNPMHITSYLDIDRATRAPNSVHHPLDTLLNQRGAFLHEFRQGCAPGLLSRVVFVLPQDDLIDIETGHAGVDALLEDVLCELVGAVHDEGDFAERGVADALEAREVELDILDAVVGAVDVADGGRQEVNPRRDEL